MDKQKILKNFGFNFKMVRMKLKLSQDNIVDKTGIIFTSGVDSLKYKEVGFIFEADGKTVYRSTNTVYTSINGSQFAASDFDGAKYIFALADSIREIPSMCKICKKKSIFNFRNSDNKNTICLDKNIYEPLCFDCFSRKQENLFK